MKTFFMYFQIIMMLTGVLSAHAQTIDLLNTEKIKPNGVIIKPVNFNDRKCIQVSLTDDMQTKLLNNPSSSHVTLALLPVKFQNGIIEVDIACEVNGKGSPDSRGFAGIAFHVNDDASKFEAIYLRMTNGRNAEPVPPSPRIERAIQYVSYPDWTFDRFREESPGQYEKGANISPKKWIHFKIEVNGTVAKAYLNNESAPVLTVKDLKMGAKAKGLIGLWIDNGSNGYFSNLQITTK